VIRCETVRSMSGLPAESLLIDSYTASYSKLTNSQSTSLEQEEWRDPGETAGRNRSISGAQTLKRIDLVASDNDPDDPGAPRLRIVKVRVSRACPRRLLSTRRRLPSRPARIAGTEGCGVTVLPSPRVNAVQRGGDSCNLRERPHVESCGGPRSGSSTGIL
jgi:hypothetical protein